MVKFWGRKKMFSSSPGIPPGFRILREYFSNTIVLKTSVGINSVDDFGGILCRGPGGYCAIVNIWDTIGGWDYKTGIARTGGEL